MTKGPEDKSRLNRAKLLKEDEAKRELEIKDNKLLIQDTRGRIFRLSPIGGPFLKDKKYNEEYPVLMRIQPNEEGGYDFINFVNPITRIHEKNTRRKSNNGAAS